MSFIHHANKAILHMFYLCLFFFYFSYMPFFLCFLFCLLSSFCASPTFIYIIFPSAAWKFFLYFPRCCRLYMVACVVCFCFQFFGPCMNVAFLPCIQAWLVVSQSLLGHHHTAKSFRLVWMNHSELMTIYIKSTLTLLTHKYHLIRFSYFALVQRVDWKQFFFSADAKSRWDAIL